VRCSRNLGEPLRATNIGPANGTLWAMVSSVTRLDGRYIDNGSRRLSAVEITNHGPGDVYELDLEDAERDGIRLQHIELPVPRLPAGKGSASSATGSIRLARSAAPTSPSRLSGRPSTAYRSEKSSSSASQVEMDIRVPIPLDQEGLSAANAPNAGGSSSGTTAPPMRKRKLSPRQPFTTALCAASLRRQIQMHG
jgi:hypothetical protein